MGRLWKNTDTAPEGKYLVKRRDGTIPEWPWFVLGGADPAAPAALRAYADRAERLRFDPDYVHDIRAMADEWDDFRMEKGPGDPDAQPHRQDDPAVIAEMKKGRSA
jgi:hypothetical protein